MKNKFKIIDTSSGEKIKLGRGERDDAKYKGFQLACLHDNKCLHSGLPNR